MQSISFPSDGQRRSLSTSTAMRKSILGLHDQRTACIGPSERLGRLIEVLNERQQSGSQLLYRPETRPFEDSPYQDAEPHLHLVEPRRMFQVGRGVGSPTVGAARRRGRLVGGGESRTGTGRGPDMDDLMTRVGSIVEAAFLDSVVYYNPLCSSAELY